jgi:hypothetical protein
MTPTAKQIKAAFDTSRTFDSVRVYKGHVVAKRGYFYRHGMTCETLRQSALETLKGAGISEQSVAIEASDNWNAWPKDSFFKLEIFPQVQA